jgi:periplasmic protein TonB
MKNNPILILLLALAQLCHAQAYKNEKLIYFDANGEKTKEKNAVVLEQLIKIDDTLYEINFYQPDGPMIRSIQSDDPDGNVLTGNFRSYNAVGSLDSSGTYQAGKRNGKWSVYSNGRFTQELMYEHGNLAWTKDTLQLKKENDSIAAGTKKDTAGDKVFTKVEIESAFPGGAKVWLGYINKNLHYPGNAVKKHIEGKVVIAFVVDKQGHVPVNKVFVDRSLEYSLDQEALRIIFSTPLWLPAVQNGRNVNSYKKQPIIFRLQ